jgi:hypothetical protein
MHAEILLTQSKNHNIKTQQQVIINTYVPFDQSHYPNTTMVDVRMECVRKREVMHFGNTVRHNWKRLTPKKM